MTVETTYTEQKNLRFQFGRNWTGFVRRNLNEQRIETARKHILDFLQREDLKGLDFLDIGSGSGIHSAAAFSAGANRIFSFDYDPNSVSATNLVRNKRGNPDSWTICRGDILDDNFVGSLGQWSLVYSWGVLHHTGNVWRAIENASKAVALGGQFYIALYSADYVHDVWPAHLARSGVADHNALQPTIQQVKTKAEFWLAIKHKYNVSSRFQRQAMVVWYVWHYMMGRSLRRLPEFVLRLIRYRMARGMSLFVDVRDWLGGWPMEFVHDEEVIQFLRGRGFVLANIKTGEANTEFLFIRRS
jgi:2-polyprenyl-6-hydroxyphenyl methylase/3-demethylubiquinone-9 3-methyltransferase